VGAGGLLPWRRRQRPTVQLNLKVEDAKPVALALLRLAEMVVDGEGAEVVR